MNKFLLLFFCLLTGLSSIAQTGRQVSGTLKDSTGTPVAAASVRLTSVRDTLSTRTDAKGAFSFSNIKSSAFLISVSSLGYQPVYRRYLYNEGSTPLVLDPIILKTESKMLNEVVISGAPAVTIKEDTVEFRASDYKVRENSVAEDVLKKLPGIEVDKDGNIKAQGKAITRVRVNGKDFFGGDVKTATQQLPADIIDKLQIVDDYGDQANLTGIKNGDPEKILNIQIRPDKNKGYFVKGTVGGGNLERYQATVSANAFNNSQQVSFLGNLNNTNASLFSFTEGGGQGGQFRQFGGGGRGQRAMGQNQPGGDGITAVGSIGLNYRDEWSKKLSSYGSYSFSRRDNNVLSNQLQQNSFRDNLILNDQDNTNNTLSSNHRLNWNLEYRPDSINYLKFSPSFTYARSDADGISRFVQNNNGQLNSQGFNTNTSATETPTLGARLLLNHRFAKRGRNVSLNLSLNNYENTYDDDQLNQYTNYLPSGNSDIYLRQQQNIINRNLSSGASFSYNEPLSSSSNLELNYNFNQSRYKNERETMDVNAQGAASRNISQSNDYDYSFTTNRIGLNYRVNQKRYNYSLGVSVQPTLLEGNAILSGVTNSYRNKGFNFIPVARYSYNFSKTRSFNASYFGRSNEPSYNQLQPLPDVSNPQYPVFGNPNLNAEFNHRINLRYNNFDFNTGNVLFTNLSASFIQNRIVTNLIRREDPVIGLVQETRYLNTDGYYNVNALYHFAKPFADRKYVVSFHGSADYNNNVSFSNNQKNTGRNWIFSQGLNMQINPAKWLEINPGTSYSFNKNTNDILTNSNSRVSSWGLNFNSKTYFLKSWLIGTDFSKIFNYGTSTALATNPLILNTYLEKQFFKDKSAALRVQAYDLFNQSTSYTHSVNGNMITDSRSNRLSRYFMLTFSMRLQKFVGKQPEQQEMPGRGRDRFRREAAEF